jgi:hypothetical protein
MADSGTVKCDFEQDLNVTWSMTRLKTNLSVLLQQLQLVIQTTSRFVHLRESH